MAEIVQVDSEANSRDEKISTFREKDPEAYAEKVSTESGVNEDDSIDEAIGDITDDIVLDSALQLVTKTLDVTDDPNLSPYTFRAFFLGMGLACFGAVIAEIFYFKPQTILVNAIFLEIIAFVLGEATTYIPRWGPIGRFLNPGDFNVKEHVFITIMASSAAVCALGTEQLAVQSLYYNETPNAGSAIFMLLSSQMLGYGFLGVMRKLFVYPTKMLWPLQLPLASLFQSLHLNKALAKKRLRVFWWVCLFVICWEMVPEYIFPLTAGISIFCLADQHNAAFTYLFGGANGDEGLGFLSWCMDWQYVGTDSLVLPLNTLFNQFIGYIICIGLTTGIYWGNLWVSYDLAPLSQTEL
jgi:OPT family oligopeptide transporter